MSAQRNLMVQKVNISPDILQYWEKCMKHNLRQIINRWLLKPEDAGKKFEHHGRVFQIIGMTDADQHTIVQEMIDGNPVYWECTTDFVQSKLGLFYVEWVTVAGHKITRNRGYDLNSLHLPPLKPSRKKKSEPVEEEPEVEMVSYDEEAGSMMSMSDELGDEY